MKQIFTSDVAAIGGQLDDSSTVAATEDQTSQVRITPQRGVHANLRNQSGTEVGTASAPLRTDPTGSTIQPVSGTVTSNQGGAPWQVQSNSANIATEGTLSTLNGKVTACNTGAVVVTTLPALPTGTNTIGSVKLTDGTDTANITSAGNLNTDITTIAGTAPTTVGKLDVKGADGDVFVRQATASNLNATVVGTGTFVVQDNQVGTDNGGFTDGTTKVFNAGFIFDETAGTALTENDNAAARIDSKRAQICTIEDETTRGRRTTVTAANALKVDGSAVTQPVGDASGSLTVDAPIGTPVNVQVGDGTRTATVRDTGASDSLNVAIVDGSGNQIVSFGGGTEYTEAVAAAANPVGKAAILVSDSTPALEVAEGENVAQRGTRYGAAYTQIVTSAGAFVDSFGGGTQYTDDTSTHSTGSTVGNIMMAAATPTDGSVDANDIGAVAMTTDRRLHVDTELPTAAALADNTANPTVPGVGAYLMLWDGVGSNWDRAIVGTPSSDAVSTSAFTGLLGVVSNYVYNGSTHDRQRTVTNGTDSTGTGITASGVLAQFDDTSPTSITENRFGNLRISQNRNLYGTIRDAAGNERGVNVDANNGALVAGTIAHDTADAGNPVKIGSQATDYQPDTEDAQGRSEVTAADRADLALNLRGEQIEGVNGLYHLFDGSFPDTGLDGVYDDSPTSSTSESVECWNYRFATVGMTLDSTNTPTDIQIQVQVSYDNSNFFDLKNGCLGQWIFDDTFVATAKNVAYSFPIAANFIRIKVTCTGTDASNTFTVDNSFIHLRN